MRTYALNDAHRIIRKYIAESWEKNVAPARGCPVVVFQSALDKRHSAEMDTISLLADLQGPTQLNDGTFPAPDLTVEAEDYIELVLPVLREKYSWLK